MKHLDLFSGIGGFALAAQWMGWETVAFVEWEEFPQQVLKKNFPGVPVYGDIKDFNDEIEKQTTKNPIGIRCNRELGEKEPKNGRFGELGTGDYYERIHIITGGFPCQPFSHAGKRKGKEDDRHLWPEMLRTIQLVRPTWVIGENVSGLTSMENGKTLDRILSDLEAEGFSTESFLIPACGVGAWHRRERLWIVGYSEHTSIRWRRKKARQNGLREPSGASGVRHEEHSSRTNSNGIGSHRTKEQLQGETELRNQQERRSEGLGEDVPCSNKLRPQGVGTNGDSLRQRQGQERGQPGLHGGGEVWNPEPQLGRMASRFPCGVDGYFDSEPEGVPRVDTGIKDRANRLKGLGNAIVPQVVYEIYKAIELSTH